MAGLGPAIHDFSARPSNKEVVDPRVKPGDDAKPRGDGYAPLPHSRPRNRR